LCGNNSARAFRAQSITCRLPGIDFGERFFFLFLSRVGIGRGVVQVRIKKGCTTLFTLYIYILCPAAPPTAMCLEVAIRAENAPDLTQDWDVFLKQVCSAHLLLLFHPLRLHPQPCSDSSLSLFSSSRQRL